jgi:hypothetical protein
MDKNSLLFTNIKVNKSLVEEVFEFDCNKLDVTEGDVIAKYTLALSQYLIYLQFEINKTKVQKRGKQRYLDACVSVNLDKEILKKFKTKGDAVNYIVKMDPNLDKTQLEADILQDELTLVEGIDKTITELITTFKRELTRRENELYITRKERYSK